MVLRFAGRGTGVPADIVLMPRKSGAALTDEHPNQHKIAGPSRAFPAPTYPMNGLRVYRVTPSGPNGRLSGLRETKRNPRHKMARCELRIKPLVLYLRVV